MLIDFHVHTFLDKLCPKAVNSLAEKAGLHAYTDGTLSMTSALMKEQGVDKFVVLNISVNEKTQRNVNDYAISINSENIIAFGSVYPYSNEAIYELERLRDNGVKGIKFHAEYQNFEIDDEKVFKIYEKAIALGLIISFHGGVDLGFTTPVKATPKGMANIYKSLPYDKFVFAHFGGYNMFDDAIKYLADTKVNIDTAFSQNKIEKQTAEKIINTFGADRVLFATDCPWDTPKDTFKFINSLKLTDEQKQLIFYKNACKLLKIK